MSDDLDTTKRGLPLAATPLFAPCWGCNHTLQCETQAECISPGVSQLDWEMVENIAIRLREMLWDDATDMTQGAMVGHPVECLAFAEWWIQRAKGLPTTVPGDYPVFRANKAICESPENEPHR